MKRHRHSHRVEGVNERLRVRGAQPPASEGVVPRTDPRFEPMVREFSERTQRIRARQLAPVDPDAPVHVVTCHPVSPEVAAALQTIGEAAFERDRRSA